MREVSILKFREGSNDLFGIRLFGIRFRFTKLFPIVWGSLVNLKMIV